MHRHPARTTIGPLLLVIAAVTMFAGAAWQSAHATRETELRHVEMDLVVPWHGQWWDVTIGMVLRDEPGSAFDQAAAEARSAMLGRFPGAIERAHGEVGAQYSLNGYKWNGGSTSWAYNGAGRPSGLSGDHNAIGAGASVWSTVGADWEFTGGGSTNAGTGACSSSSGMDGNNTVGWGTQSGSTLAVTCTWHNAGRAVEFDMEFDPDWDWTTGSPAMVDLQSVATHEFGHALGLGHSNDSDAVMYFSYTVGDDKRDPRPDDVAAIVAKYGEAGSPPPEPTATPTSPPPPAVTSTPTSPPPAGPSSTPEPTITRTPTPSSTAARPTATPTARATRTSTPATTATPTRTPPPRPSLPLSPGINLLVWPREDADPADGLGGMAGIVDVVYSWDPRGEQWLHYGPSLPDYVNTLERLEEGHAYWIVATRQAAIALP